MRFHIEIKGVLKKHKSFEVISQLQDIQSLKMKSLYWWAKGLSKPILRPRAEQELGNMGVPHVFLSKLSCNILEEVFCMTSSQLLGHGAIERLPILVNKCYAHPDIPHVLFEEKSPNIPKCKVYF